MLFPRVDLEACPRFKAAMEKRLKFQSSSISPSSPSFSLDPLFFHALTKEVPNGVASNYHDLIFHPFEILMRFPN